MVHCDDHLKHDGLLTLIRLKWSWKIFLLVISQILGLFLNTLTADDKYSFRNSENLQ